MSKRRRHTRHSLLLRIRNWMGHIKILVMSWYEKTAEKVLRSKAVRKVQKGKSVGSKLTSKVHDSTQRSWSKFVGSFFRSKLVTGTSDLVERAKDSTTESLDRVSHSRVFQSIDNIVSRVKHRWLLIADEFNLRLEQSPLLRLLTAPFRWTYKTIAALFEWSSAWLFTRNYMLLIPGVVSLLLAVPLAACLIRIPFHSVQQKANHYRLAAKEALNSGDTNAAELFYAKLVQLGMMSSNIDYERGLKLAEDHKYDEAYEVMVKIAPHDSTGHYPAHLWIADVLMSELVELPEEEYKTVLKHHLETAYGAFPHLDAVKLNLAHFYQRENQADKALEVLSEVNPHGLEPAFLLRSAAIYSKLGYHENAIKMERLAKEKLDNAANVGLSREIFGLSAANYEIQGRYFEAIQEFQKGVDAIKDEKLLNYAQKATDYYLRILENNRKRQAEYLKIVAFTLEHKIMTPEVQEKVIRSMLNNNLHTQLAPVFTKAFKEEVVSIETYERVVEVFTRKKDYATAKQMYFAILDRDPLSKVSANNLAWILSNIEPLDLETALLLCSVALQGDPNDSAFLETRGQIFVKQGKWKEAVDDLRRAANGLPNEAGIHASLSKCFLALGDNELADVHQQRSLALQEN